MNIETLRNEAKIMGGPVDALADFMVDISPGVYSVDHELAIREGVLIATIKAFTDSEDDRDALPPLPNGYRLVESSVSRMLDAGKVVEATLRFSWALHEGVFIPAHWIERDAAACIVMHRIFGSDETRWPALERAA